MDAEQNSGNNTWKNKCFIIDKHFLRLDFFSNRERNIVNVFQKLIFSLESLRLPHQVYTMLKVEGVS